MIDRERFIYLDVHDLACPDCVAVQRGIYQNIPPRKIADYEKAWQGHECILQIKSQTGGVGYAREQTGG